MRLIILVASCAVFPAPSMTVGAKDSPGSLKMMDQAEAACAGARADRSDATPKYSATYDDVHIRLIVVNRESVRARRSSGSRVSKRFSFGDRCHLSVGALLAEITRGRWIPCS